MADKYVNKTSIVAASAPRVSLPRVGAFDGMVSVLNKFVNTHADRLDADIVREAKIEGMKAGLESGFTPTRGGSLAERAYDDAGVQVQYNMTVTNLSGELDMLSADPQLSANPTALSEKANEVVAKHVLDLPPETQPLMAVAAKQKVNSMAVAAKTKAFKVRLDELEGSFTTAEAALHKDILNAAENGEEASLLTAQAKYKDLLVQHGPIATGGRGVLTPKEIATKLNKVHEDTVASLVKGNFRRTPYADQMRFINEFQADKELDEFLGADKKDKILGELYTELGRGASERSRAHEELERVRGDKARETSVAFWKNPTQQGLDEAARYVDGATYNTMKKGLEGESYTDQPEIEGEFERKFLTGTLTRDEVVDAIGNGLSGKSAREYVKRIEEQQTKFEFVSWPDWKEMDRRVKDDFPVERGMLGYISGGKENQEVQNRILTKMYSRVKDQYENWKSTGKDRPDVLREYQLIQKAEQDSIAQRKEREGSPLNKVPMKYRTNPEQLLLDADAGLLPPETVKRYSDVLSDAINSGELKAEPGVSEGLRGKKSGGTMGDKLKGLFGG